MYDREARYFYLIHGNQDIAQFSDLTTEETASDEEACELIFTITQNLDDHWVDTIHDQSTFKVVLRDKINHRCTSVGDCILVKQGENEKLYRCEGKGWLKLRDNKARSLVSQP